MHLLKHSSVLWELENQRLELKRQALVVGTCSTHVSILEIDIPIALRLVMQGKAELSLMASSATISRSILKHHDGPTTAVLSPCRMRTAHLHF